MSSEAGEPGTCRLGIVSDIHYAGAAERARGDDFELAGISHPLLRFLVRVHRHYIWQRWPLRLNYLLDRFLEQTPGVDYLVANGDFSCNTAALGLSDPGAFASAEECLGKLRAVFGARLRTTFGDHELGKLSFVGKRGGMRLASWQAATQELNMEPYWRLDLGVYVLFGVTSSLIALPVFKHDALAEELPSWEKLRETHLQRIREGFTSLEPDRRVLLFCHDPTALPFLWHDEVVRSRLGQIEQTIIGHLHTRLVLWQSRVLAGMPPVNFLGHTGRRMSTALREARHWRHFRVRLCPALGGTQLLNDGGYYTARLALDGSRPVQFTFHPLPKPRRPPELRFEGSAAR